MLCPHGLSHKAWCVKCTPARPTDDEVPFVKRIVLSSFHETRFGLWALDANGQVYEVSNEMVNAGLGTNGPEWKAEGAMMERTHDYITERARIEGARAALEEGAKWILGCGGPNSNKWHEGLLSLRDGEYSLPTDPAPFGNVTSGESITLPSPTGRYVLTKVAFVDPKEGK